MFPGNRSVVVDPQRLPESECVISKSSPPVEDFPNLETDSQILDRAFDDADLDGAESTHSSVPGGSKKRQKRNSNAEAANEMELRRAFAENKSRPLADIGESLRVDQLGSSAEKTRQIFAMCWYVKDARMRPGY